MKSDSSAYKRNSAAGASRDNEAPPHAAAQNAHIGPPIDPASVAESILRAIQNTSRMRSPAEHRQATRYHYCVPMTLHIDDPRARGTRIVRAASSNISAGGFAFIFDAALSTGSTVRAQFDSLPGKPQIAGLVRSCVRICGTQHRIGVEYQ